VTGSRPNQQTGNQKSRLSAAFSAVADGFKLPVLERIVVPYMLRKKFRD